MKYGPFLVLQFCPVFDPFLPNCCQPCRAHFFTFPSSRYLSQNPPFLQGLLLLLVALLPLVAESAPTIQSLVPAIAFTPVVCPIAFAHSIIKKVFRSFHANIHYFPFHFSCLFFRCSSLLSDHSDHSNCLYKQLISMISQL